MRYILRKKDELLPTTFTDWLTTNKDKIEIDIADENVKGAQLWAFFRNDGNVAYDALKKHLVEAQGFICCYCGRRIEIDRHTSIEHIQPKSTYKNIIFDVDNLVTSCNGGSKSKIHLVQKGETLMDIAEQYEVDVEHLEDVYVNADELKLLGKRYDLENLSVGDRIIIIPLVDKKSQHCDIKKGKEEIDINPLQTDCANHFAYNRSNGEINISKKNQLTVGRLGLNNNRYLNQLRKKTIDVSFIIKENLIADFGHSKKMFNQNLQKIIKNLDDKNRKPDEKLESFVFVKTWSLLN